MPAFNSSSGLVKRIFIRSTTFWSRAVTVSARTKGSRSATFFTKTLRLALAPGEQEDEAGEDAQQQDAENGPEAVGRVVALERDRDQQRRARR